jgi:hypothetical protein
MHQLAQNQVKAGAATRDFSCSIVSTLTRSRVRSLLILRLKCLKLCDCQSSDFRDRPLTLIVQPGCEVIDRPKIQ